MSIKTVYTNPQWQEILAANDLTTFEHWWALQLKAVDEGNAGRGQNGWSRVCIHPLTAADGTSRRVVIKRQSNYRSRTITHPLRGIATFVKEYNFISRYEKLGIPATTAIYCATREQNGELQAILVTEFLTDYHALEDILARWQSLPQADNREQRKQIIDNVATSIARLHHAGLEHRCLFPKHIFVPDDLERYESRLIDLEKTRGKPWSRRRRLRDLAALARRTISVNNRDRMRFFHSYFNIRQMDENAKKLWRQIAKRRKNNS